MLNLRDLYLVDSRVFFSQHFYFLFKKEDLIETTEELFVLKFNEEVLLGNIYELGYEYLVVYLPKEKKPSKNFRKVLDPLFLDFLRYEKKNGGYYYNNVDFFYNKKNNSKISIFIDNSGNAIHLLNHDIVYPFSEDIEKNINRIGFDNFLLLYQKNKNYFSQNLFNDLVSILAKRL